MPQDDDRVDVLVDGFVAALIEDGVSLNDIGVALVGHGLRCINVASGPRHTLEIVEQVAKNLRTGPGDGVGRVVQ